MHFGKPARCAAIALACAIGAAFFLVGVRPVESHPAAALSETPTVKTPLWSARRLPTVIADSVESAAQAKAGAALTATLRSIVAPYDACVSVDGPGGALVRLNAGTALAPASTMKVLTAVTAVDRLGPNHHFTTKVSADDNGNLVVVGGGDPMLATPEYIAFRHSQPRFHNAAYTPLTDLADAIVAAGIRNVSGALLVDDHVHDTLRYLPDWKPNYGAEGDVGSLGALSVDGGFSQTNGQLPAADPALLTGQRLAALLAARGVTIAGGVQRGRLTNGREVAHVDSPALSDIVAELLTSSDDYTAELLLRDLAVTNGDTPATTAAGIQIVVAEMTHLGIPTAGLVLHDGSGLAPNNRVTRTTLLALMELTSRPKFAAVDRGLAVAAQSGTLLGRFGGSPLAGKLRGKTGSIDSVVGLIGVIDGPNELHFAFVANGGFSTSAGAQLQADVAGAIGSTPDVRAPADLVPPP